MTVKEGSSNSLPTNPMPSTAHNSSSEYSTWPEGSRLEPMILSGILVDDEPELPQQRKVNHQLPLTLLLSISAHVLIFAVAAWSASKSPRSAVVTENPRPGPSVQIRILDSTPRSLQETMPSSDAPVEAPVEVAVDTDVALSPANERPTIETPTVSGGTSPQPNTVTVAEQSASTPTAIEPPQGAPRISLPTSHDLRAAIQMRDTAERQRSLDILCEPNQQRQQIMDCGATESTQHMALAEQNDIVEYFNRIPLPDKADTSNPMSAGGRVKANLDVVDAQLGTTQTRKRIMGIP